MPDTFARLKAALADRYRVERELGSGGMAVVYLAEDLKHGRQVAIKVLRPELAVSLGANRFLQEIQLTANLQHPHILPLYDSGETGDFLYYVMPYVKGESLRERLDREGRLPVADAIDLTEDIAAALSYAHEQGVVHRDIKPENVLLASGQAVVADFGIARAVEVAGGERLTGTGLAIGTPAYMSPEQAMGLEDVDARSDVYALGCVVYEMVGGRAPFEATTPQALLAKHAADTVPGLRTSDPAIPVYVERAVERALAKSPADRFQSASTFAEALTTGTVVARVGPRRWPRRGVAGVAGAVLVAGAAWALSTMASGPAIERLAVLPFTNLVNDPDQEYLVQGVHTGLIDELALAGASVIARRSVMQYQNSDKPVRDIARELGIDALIDVSLERTGDSLRIRAQLIDGRTEEPLWTQSFRGDLRNIVGLERQVTRAIVDEIELALTPEAEARLASARPVNPDAYEAYLKGRFHSDRFTPADLETALRYFQSALEQDPDYALAYRGVAGVWARRVVLGIVPPLEAGPKWKEAATQAVALDGTIAEAHVALAMTRWWVDFDWDGAEEAFRQAIALDPNGRSARVPYAHFLTAMKRPQEAAPYIERALEIDPLNSFVQAQYGLQLMLAGRYGDAITQLRKTIEMAPELPLSRFGLSGALYKMGRYEEGYAELLAFFTALGDREVANALERGHTVGGYREAARRAADVLAERSRATFVKPMHVSALYDYAGQIDQAFDWLEKALDARDHDMVYLSVIPISDSLRADPRFQDLLRRMNLPQ